jgi:uncharacterized protein (TIGR03437 family)
VIRGCIIAAFSLSAFAQLIPSGSPVPRTSKPPVVFINGYQNLCPATSFSNTFGAADQVLKANGEVSLFFSTCSLGPTASIEDLGAAFGDFLATLRFEDGQRVDVVDVVAHSMGGLVLRSYLSGKQNAVGVFRPPAATHVRKAVFLATPHFGTGVALLFGFTTQVQELASGSRFLFDLGTWNQGADDLRGVDAITAIGNGGSGVAVMPGFDDGVVALTSASLGFYMPGRTRVVPFCHVGTGGLLGFAGLCAPNAQSIANIQSATHDSARIIISFFNGTEEWRSVGTAGEDDPFLKSNGGLDVAARTADDAMLKLASLDAASARGTSKRLNLPTPDVAYTDLFPAGPLTLTAVSGGLTVSNPIFLQAGGTQAFTIKPGPWIARVLPAAANVFPLSVAPGMFVAIYGRSLARDTAQADGLPFPVQLSDAQVLINGAPMSLYYVSPAQIDAVIPDMAPGLVKLTVRNSSGAHTVNVLVEPAVPAIFTKDASGSGPAAAIRAVDNRVVSPDNPLHSGETVELFATGLGSTTRRDGLDYANQQPTVTITGQPCEVTFAGRAPGYAGLDQINCIVPAGIGTSSSAPVRMTSGNRSSNVATLVVE